jgi:hypothetical protein
MYRAMRYAIGTPNRGLVLAPTAVWDGSPNFGFTIRGTADASYKPYKDSGQSVGGHAVFLNDAPISEKSKVQQSVTLSITEAESISGADCAQDMLFGMRVMESMGLNIKKPMKLFTDNKGASDHANSWASGGRMRHVSVRLHFLRQIKENRLIDTEWCRGQDMPADLYTKYLPGPLFQKHTKIFCEEDEYNK